MNELQCKEFSVSVAEDGHTIELARNLRAEVFGNLADSDSENDGYDEFCEHLVVIDKEKNKVVGTYRLLLGSRAKEIGFHSEKIFEIDNIKKIKGEILELGRSCVHKDYRKNLIINLLWKGIAGYAYTHRVRFLFGCPRLDTKKTDEISRIFSFLREKYYADDALRVYPLSECRIELKGASKIENQDAVFKQLSPLVKGYLRMGALVCGEPALNKEFGSIVLFMLLDMHKIKSSYGERFGVLLDKDN